MKDKETRKWYNFGPGFNDLYLTESEHDTLVKIYEESTSFTDLNEKLYKFKEDQKNEFIFNQFRDRAGHANQHLVEIFHQSKKPWNSLTEMEKRMMGLAFSNLEFICSGKSN